MEGRMHQLNFRTADPYDAVPRMLDHARKSGFVPQVLRLESTGAGHYMLHAVFGPASGISVATLTEQLRRIVSVSDLQAENANDLQFFDATA
jgi:acetolactate synthase regulatory subunit